MKANRKYLVVGLTLLFAAAVGGCNRGDGVRAAREDETAVISPAEQDFVMKAERDHLAEIHLARMALQKSQNEGVRDYAETIVRDHTGGLEKLNELMRRYNVPQAVDPASETRQESDRFATLSPPEFDREYVNLTVANHQRAIELFRQQAATAQNPDIKECAEEMLPTLDDHLRRAQELQSKVIKSAVWPY